MIWVATASVLLRLAAALLAFRLALTFRDRRVYLLAAAVLALAITELYSNYAFFHEHDHVHSSTIAARFVGSLFLLVGVIFLHGFLLDRTSQDRIYRELFDGADDAMIVADRTGRYLQANDAACLLLGYPRKQLLKMSVADLKTPPGVASPVDAFRDYVSSGQLSGLFRFLPGGNGPERVLDFRACILPDGRCLSTLRDATARVNEHQRLLESRQFLERAEAAAGVGSWVWDPASGALTWSANHFALFGVDPRTFTGTYEDFRKCVLPADLDRVEHEVRELERLGTGHVEFSILRPDGAVRLMESDVQVMRDVAGNRLFGVVRDITEQRRTESALRSAERTYRELFELSPQPMWVYDPHTLRFLRVNQAAVDRYGFSRQQFETMSILDIRSRDEAHRLRLYLQSTDRPSRTGTRWVHRTRDGQELRVEIWSQEIEFEGRTARLVIVNDVTAMEAALETVSAQAAILELVATGRPIEEVLDAVRDLAEAHVAGTICTFLTVRGDRLYPFGRSRFPEEYLRRVEGLPIGPNMGSCGTSAYRRERVVVQDILTDPLWESARDVAPRFGVRACWSQPVLSHQGNVLATFALYHPQPRVPNESEIHLLETCAHLVGIAMDRDNDRRALELNEARLRKIFDTSLVGISITRPDGSYIDANDSLLRIIGRTREDLRAGRIDWRKITPPEFAHTDERAYEEFKRGEVTPYEKQYIRPDGTRVPVVLSLGRLAENEAVAFVLDLTNTRLLQDQLQQTQTVLEAFFASAPLQIGIVEVPDDIDDIRLLMVNEAFDRAVRAEPGSMAGKWVSEISNKELAKLWAHRYRETRATGKSTQHEYSGVEPGSFWCTTLSAIPGPDKRLYVFLTEDITRRRTLEGELRQAQKMDAVGQLASGVAHDFSNLLTAIFGYTALARRTLEPHHPATRALDRVDEAAGQAAGVTRSLLTFARRESTEKRPVRLSEVIELAVRLLRRSIPASIDLRTEIAPAPELFVLGDATQLQQVVLNLAINARDAMPAGGILTISLAHVPADHSPGSARLTIQDTGHGMPPEVLARVFEPFFTTKPPGTGTGLGLSITHGIVSDHGGQIEASSTPGRGTRFVITLPCTPPPAPTLAEPPRIDAQRGDRVLLISPHIYTREIVASMLRTLGYEPVQAGDGASAKSHAQTLGDHLRLVILDADGPGDETLDSLQSELNLPGSVPFIVTAPPGTSPPLSFSGRVRVLHKPFQIHELSDSIRDALQPSEPAG